MLLLGFTMRSKWVDSFTTILINLLVNELKITIRKDAITMAIKLVRQGDIVLIAGKGHESYQEIKGNLYPFNDLKIAQPIFLKTD